MIKEGKAIKVLLIDNVPQSARKWFEQAGYEVEHLPGENLTEALLFKKMSDIHIVGISHRTPVPLTKEILRNGHRLLAVACFCMQTSDVDMYTCNEMGTAVFNSPYGDVPSIAELVIAYLIGLSRQLGDRNLEMHQHIWKKTSSGCHELRNKVLGIIGYEYVGSLVGVLAESLGMHVLWYDQRPLMPIGNSTACATLEEVLQSADFVSLHVSDVPENKHLLKRDHIQCMKKGAYLINTSFGDVIDMEAVLDALRSKHLAGVALDVFPMDIETMLISDNMEKRKDIDSSDSSISPPSVPSGFPPWLSSLIQCSNVLLTPHIGETTLEGQYRIGTEVSQQVIRYIHEGRTVGCINLPTIDPDPLSVGNSRRRIINIHRNVRGVIREIDYILSEVNICMQVIETHGDLGYIIIDVETNEVTPEMVADLAGMGNTIRTRIV